MHRAGFRFARYADDFVVLTRSKRQAQEALELVQQVLETQLQLRLNPEKTRRTTYGKGYEYLGFFLSSRSRRMRSKSQGGNSACLLPAYCQSVTFWQQRFQRRKTRRLEPRVARFALQPWATRSNAFGVRTCLEYA